MQINKIHSSVVRGTHIYARASTRYLDRDRARWSVWENEFKSAVDHHLLLLSTGQIKEHAVRSALLQDLTARAKRLLSVHGLHVIDASYDAVLSYQFTHQGKTIVEYDVTFCEGKVLTQSTPPGVHDERNDGQRHYRELCCTGRGRSEVHPDRQREAERDQGRSSADHVSNEVVCTG